MPLRIFLIASLVLSSGCLFQSAAPVDIASIATQNSHLLSEVPGHITFNPRNTDPSCDADSCTFSNDDVDIILEDLKRAQDQVDYLSKALIESTHEKNGLVRMLVECEYGKAVRERTIGDLEQQSFRDSIVSVMKQIGLGLACGALLVP